LLLSRLAIAAADDLLRHCESSEAIQRSMQAAPGLLRRSRSSQRRKGSRSRDAVRTRVVVISNLQATKAFALRTDLVRGCQRWSPVTSRPVLQATNVSARRKRKAERRRTLIRILRTFGCGSRLARRARPSAFHRGSRQRESSSLRLSFRPGFRGRGLYGRYPPSPVPVQRAPRAPVIMPGD
jgi:hypothetical protein